MPQNVPNYLLTLENHLDLLILPSLHPRSTHPWKGEMSSVEPTAGELAGRQPQFKTQAPQEESNPNTCYDLELDPCFPWTSVSSSLK